MDKNTIIGFVLIAAVLIGFTVLNQPSKEDIARQQEQYRRDSIQHALNLQAEQDRLAADTNSVVQGGQTDATKDFFASAVPTTADSSSVLIDSTAINLSQKEQIITLQNEKVKIDFSTKGGQMVVVQMKGTTTGYDGDSLYLFNNDADFSLTLTNKQGAKLDTRDLFFTPVKQEDNTLIMRYSYSDNQYVDFIYQLSTDDYMLKYDINMVGMQQALSRETADIFELNWAQKLHRQEKSIKNEQRHTRVYYKYAGDDVNELSESSDVREQELKEPVKWVAFKNQFFGTVLIADEKIETTVLDSKVLSGEEYLKACQARMYVPANVDVKQNTLQAGFKYYLGPMDYSHLKTYDKEIKDATKQLDLDKLVPLGWALFRWINQYFVIPIFNLLKDTGLSMGIVILLLTVIVKLIISPLTYKSFMSSAKMRVLRPQVEAINAKYPKQEQAMEKQKETMALYSRVGASPMAGCIPMLLQMPILIALFQFFPNAIELRQQSFLWADDLSTYDAIISWSANIPVISWALGNHLSLFCVLMTLTNIVYTKFNMDATNTGQQQMPGMKWMMYLMPLIFLFVLNDYPSGLTYYYFISLLITIVLTLIFRFAIDEEKVLAKLEANKAKPKKKSGFMARLEEAQRMQQQQLNQKNKTNSTKRKR